MTYWIRSLPTQTSLRFYNDTLPFWQASLIILRRQDNCDLEEPVFVNIKEKHTN